MLLSSDQTTILLLAFLVQRKASQSTQPTICNDRTPCFWTMISLSIVGQVTTLAKQMHCPLISSHCKLPEDTVVIIISMKPEFVSYPSIHCQCNNQLLQKWNFQLSHLWYKIQRKYFISNCINSKKINYQIVVSLLPVKKETLKKLK